MTDIPYSMFFFHDANEDEVVSLREAVEGLKTVGLAQSIDTDAFCALHGEDFDWISDVDLITKLIISGWAIDTYDGLYDLMENLGYAWTTDEFFFAGWEGTNEERFSFWVREAFYDGDAEWH